MCCCLYHHGERIPMSALWRCCCGKSHEEANVLLWSSKARQHATWSAQSSSPDPVLNIVINKLYKLSGRERANLTHLFSALGRYGRLERCSLTIFGNRSWRMAGTVLEQIFYFSRNCFWWLVLHMALWWLVVMPLYTVIRTDKILYCSMLTNYPFLSERVVWHLMRWVTDSSQEMYITFYISKIKIK